MIETAVMGGFKNKKVHLLHILSNVDISQAKYEREKAAQWAA
mgnify:FL=1